MSEGQDISREYSKLQIRYKQMQNELQLMRKESEDNSIRYSELLKELSQKNEELESLKNNLQNIVIAKTAELIDTAENLRKRDRLLATSSEIAISLLASSENSSSAVSKALKITGDTFKVDRVYIFETHDDASETGEHLMSHRYQWSSEAVKSDMDISKFQNVSCDKLFPRWYKEISAGNSINGLLKEFPLEEQKLFGEHNIISLLIAPIFLHGRFWGFIGVDDCHNERAWNNNEISILAALGSAIAGALIREKTRIELETAKKEAEDAAMEASAATAAKSDFLANMSHEIRTPLNGVIGIIELLSKTDLSDIQKEYITDLNYSSDMLMSLVNNVLDLSKIEAGKLEFEFKPFQLKNMLSGLCNVMKYKAKNKGLELELIIPENIPDFVVGDIFRVRQVLMNLISNSIKFTLKGKIELSLELIEETSDTNLILFNVNDTGIGIPEEKIPLLFEKFSQTDISITRKFGGTGLGLAICKMLVERMGGKIYVKSREGGQGITFSFTLPLEIPEKNMVEHENGILSAWKRPPEVLLAEDNQINRKIAANFLNSFGCNVDCAENGLEASNKFKDKSYDIIFMDMQMPVMDGLEAVRVIRKLEKKTRVPIITLTANAMDTGKTKSEEAGMDDFLTKPIDRKALFSILTKYLGHILEKDETEEIIPETEILSSPADILGIFDRKKAFAFMDNSESLLKELLEYFLTSTPEMIKELTGELEKQDLVSSERIAHTLKGSGRNLAMKKFAETAFELEKNCEAGELEKARSMLHALEHDFNDARKIIIDDEFMK